MKKSIVLIIVHFGAWPKWFNLFIKTCSANPQVSFFIFSDNEAPCSIPGNVKVFDYDMATFNRDATEEIGMNISISKAYKLCDFKPAYGLIFQDLISGFDYWGHCDTDVVFGNIRKFIAAPVRNSYDIISTKSAYLAGHFTLYKNNEFCRNLFKRSADWRRVFTRKRNYCFDECNYLWFYLLDGGSVFDFKPDIESMTHVVMRLQKEKRLKLFLKDLVVERDKVDELGNFKRWEGELTWDNGMLWDNISNSERMYFHFHLIKRELLFKRSLSSAYPDKIRISARGLSK